MQGCIGQYQIVLPAITQIACIQSGASPNGQGVGALGEAQRRQKKSKKTSDDETTGHFVGVGVLKNEKYWQSVRLIFKIMP